MFFFFYSNFRWIFAHTHPEHIDRFISVSASHPNLMWDNLHTKSPINDYWLKFAQLPYLPEMEMNHNDSTFIERTMQHLSKESNSRYVNVTNGYQITNKLDAYKYVFSRKSDWSGPLNYYRNLPFYTVRSDESVRCPCLIVIGKNLLFFTLLESEINELIFCVFFFVFEFV